MLTPQQQQALRALPSVDEVLLELEALLPEAAIPHDLLTHCVRAEIDEVRSAILAGGTLQPSAEITATGALRRVQANAQPSLRHVINATGVIIHTNLGRSALAPQALDALTAAAQGYSTLEYDTSKMERGSRSVHYEDLICTLTGAEAAIAVNNNASAVLMVLNEFAKNRKAAISRGELIEIGGSFRIPDIMDFSNAEMVEVGTTNKTHLSDYERAIEPETAMLLKVHTSNYRLVGFTENVTAKELKVLADAENAKRAASGEEKLLVYEDLGSGMLLSLPGVDEPTVSDALKGCDLVSFSGDKLLGGPQAGIIVGSKELIGRLKKNPLARALRCDKMTIAALEATLRLYLDPEQAKRDVPTLAMLCATAEETRVKAEALKAALESAVPGDACTFAVVPDISRAGGGSLPMYDIPSFAVEVALAEGSAQECVEYLAQKTAIPVIARVGHEKVLFAVRTLLNDEELEQIAAAMKAYAER